MVKFPKGFNRRTVLKGGAALGGQQVVPGRTVFPPALVEMRALDQLQVGAHHRHGQCDAHGQELRGVGVHWQAPGRVFHHDEAARFAIVLRHEGELQEPITVPLRVAGGIFGRVCGGGMVGCGPRVGVEKSALSRQP